MGTSTVSRTGVDVFCIGNKMAPKVVRTSASYAFLRKPSNFMAPTLLSRRQFEPFLSLHTEFDRRGNGEEYGGGSVACM